MISLINMSVWEANTAPGPYVAYKITTFERDTQNFPLLSSRKFFNTFRGEGKCYAQIAIRFLPGPFCTLLYIIMFHQGKRGGF